MIDITKDKNNVFWAENGRGIFGLYREHGMYCNDTYSNCYYKTLKDAKEHAKAIANNGFEYTSCDCVKHL